MSKNNHITTPCTIRRTVPNGYMIKTASRVMIVNRADVVPTPGGWGLIVRGEKGAENENQI